MFQALREFKSRIPAWVALWLPLAWVVGAVGIDLSLARSPIRVWPGAGLRLLPFTSTPGGLSTSKVDSSHGDMVLTMHLDSGVAWPVAGTIAFLNRKGLSLSGAGHVELDISRTDIASLTLCLVEDIPGFTSDARWQTARYECMDQELVPGTPSYRIPLEKFTTPSWWYSTAGILPSTLGPERRERIVRLVLQTGPGSALGKDLELRISRLAIAPSNFALHATVGGLALLLVGCHFLALRLLRKPAGAVPPKAIPTSADPFFLPVEATSYADREREAVVQCIGHDYVDPELSLEKIARSTGVPVDRVTQHVKMASGLLFKAYLNKVRGEAARKLLQETDLPIAEVSQRVGYSNTPHFNRVFKELFDTTPSALREGPKSEATEELG